MSTDARSHICLPAKLKLRARVGPRSAAGHGAGGGAQNVTDRHFDERFTINAKCHFCDM